MQPQKAVAFKNMNESLERASRSMAIILKMQASLGDPEERWPGISEVNIEFLSEPRPVRLHFVTTGFRRPRQLLQLDCITYKELGQWKHETPSVYRRMPSWKRQ